MNRLLRIEAAAEYLGISPDAIRLYIKNETIVPVLLPPCRGKNPMRKILIDVYDLDKLITAQKSNGKRVPSRKDLVDKVLCEPQTDSGEQPQRGQSGRANAAEDSGGRLGERPSGSEWKNHLYASRR